MDDLSHQTKEMLSWMAAAYVLQEAEELLFVGQYWAMHNYDLLSLHDSQHELVTMNRNGRNGWFNDLAEGIWVTAGMTPGEGPRTLALRILDEGDIPVASETARVTNTARAAAYIGNWLALHGDRKASVLPGVRKADLGASRDDRILGFDRSAEWLDREPPQQSEDPGYWLFMLAIDDEPVCLVDLKDGQWTGRDVNGKWLGYSGVPEYVLEDGTLGCPVAMRVSASDSKGAPVSSTDVQVSEAKALARSLREQSLRVEIEPLYETPSTGFKFTLGDVTGWDKWF